MHWLKNLALKQTGKFIMSILGLILLLFSTFSLSAFLAILGTSLLFWGVILAYLTPTKHLPLTVLNAFAHKADNIERIIIQFGLSEKAIYLPPKNLKNIESSLIFIPKGPFSQLPHSEKITNGLISEDGDGIFLTPPGLGFSMLFENVFKKSFTKIRPTELSSVIPKIIVDDLELAENIFFSFEGNIVSIDVVGNVLNDFCVQESDLSPIYAQVGCPLSSALACVLAKTTGKPVFIQSENINQVNRVLTITYFIMEQ